MLHDKKIHFIGICGVAMSALAIAFHKKGYKITGSDKGFYPPVSTYLKDAGIEYYPGWHVDKMTHSTGSPRHELGPNAGQATDGDPDLVVVGNVAGSKNPEWLYVQEKKLEYKSYPEVIAEFFVKENSIVCAGTYGKSTSSGILTWILRENGFDPSYMFGGVPLNDMTSAELTDSKYSILEGDEYKSARWDNRPKFAHYSPTHLLLTSVVWDHADVYPTEKSYIDVFETLIKSIPKNGLIVLSAKVTHDLPEFTKLNSCPMVTYGKTEDNDYQYFDVKTTQDEITFKIKYKSEIFNLKSETLGDYMADNMTGCFALAHQIGIEPEKIIASLESFKNIKRRLEKRSAGNVKVFDDIAHSPKKAEAVLRSLRSVFDGHIYAVFEPNTGNRQRESIPGYENKFTGADTVIIPRLSNIKKDPTKPDVLGGQELADVIAKTHNDVKYIENDENLVELLATETKKDDCVVFLGSHSFRNMIEALVSRL